MIKRIFFLLIGLIFSTIALADGMSVPGASNMGGDPSLNYPNRNSIHTLLFLTPENDVMYDQVVCFNNSNDAGDYIGTAGGRGNNSYRVINSYFGSFAGPTRFCLSRVTQDGGRTRLISKVLEFGTQTMALTDTNCRASVLYCNLDAPNGMQGLPSNSTLVIPISYGNRSGFWGTGQTLGSLAGLSFNAIGSAIETELNAGATQFASNINASVDAAGCTLVGSMEAGVYTISSATGGFGPNTPSTHCFQPGSQINCTTTPSSAFPCSSPFAAGWSQQVHGQISGSNGLPCLPGPNATCNGGAGTYGGFLYYYAESEALQNSFGSEHAFSSWGASWGVLEVNSVGPGDSISVGDWISGAGLGNGIVANIIPGNITMCTGNSQCAGTVWALPTPATIGNENMTTHVCHASLGIDGNAAVLTQGPVNNSIRFWIQPQAICPYYTNPSMSLDWATGTAAHSLGLDHASENASGGSPAVLSGWPYGGAFRSPFNEVLGLTPGQLDYPTVMNTIVTQKFADFDTFQIWADPDLGLVFNGVVTPTYRNQVISWVNSLGDTNIPLSQYNYAMQWNYTAWPIANGYPPPTCNPGTQTLHATGNTTPDYCPIHTATLTGSAGATGNVGRITISNWTGDMAGIAPFHVIVGAGGSGTDTSMNNATTPAGPPQMFNIIPDALAEGNGTQTCPLSLYAVLGNANITCGMVSVAPNAAGTFTLVGRNSP